MPELTDRYIGATLRSIPEKQRADIEAELRASIGDAVEARVSGGEAPELAEKEVLTSLGDPDRLAAGYAGKPGYLIGPEHFFTYKRLLGVLLLTVVPIVMVLVGVLQAIAGEDIGSVIGEAFGSGISLIVNIAFWTTLVFALIERSDQKPSSEEWTLSSLPTLPATGGVKLSETIGSVVMLVVVIAAITMSRTVSPVVDGDGTTVPIFTPDLWSFWFPYLLAVLAAEIIFEVVKYRVGTWTRGLASVNLALNVAFAVPAIYLLVSERVLNREFFAEIGWGTAPAGDGGFVVVTVIVIGMIAVWDVVDGFRKSRR